MAIAKATTGDVPHDSLGPGTIDRDQPGNRHVWTGRPHTNSLPANANAFAYMVRTAAAIWKDTLTPAERTAWLNTPTKVLRQRPGLSGTNTRKRPWSLFLCNQAPSTYHRELCPVTAPAPEGPFPSPLIINSVNPSAHTAAIQCHIDNTDPAANIYALDIYQRKAGGYSSPANYACCALCLRFTDILPEDTTYFITVPLKYTIPTHGWLYLYARLRDRASCRTYDHSLKNY